MRVKGKLSRLWHSFRMAVAKSSKKKRYVDRHRLFAYYGNNVTFQPKILPLYSQLIRIHDNVVIGRNVEFVTHDMIHKVANSSGELKTALKERVGCIEVCENSFIGNGAILMYGIRIGPNNIIAAGSVVVKNTEPNSVYAGVPARKIGTFSDCIARRLDQELSSSIPTISLNQRITDEEVEKAWALFDSSNPGGGLGHD